MKTSSTIAPRHEPRAREKISERIGVNEQAVQTALSAARIADLTARVLPSVQHQRAALRACLV